MSKKQSPKTFWERVKKQDTGCWEWEGSINSTGYGTCAWDGAVYVTHRIAAWLYGMIEDIPAPRNADNPTHVLHVCDNRKCCNPDHLFLGSYSDNMQDAYNKKRKVQPKGDKHPNSKLSNSQASEIRILYAKGSSQKALATSYGVSQAAISRIVRNIGYIQ